MSALSILAGIQRLGKRLLPNYYHQIAGLHTLTNNYTIMKLPSIQLQTFLEPTKPQNCQIRGLKYKARLTLRCRDCYFETIDDVLNVQCKTHGRHKQRLITKKPKNTWILTSISNKPKRDW